MQSQSPDQERLESHPPAKRKRGEWIRANGGEPRSTAAGANAKPATPGSWKCAQTRKESESFGVDSSLIEGNLEAVPVQEVEKLSWPGASVQARGTRALEAMERSEGQGKDKCCAAAAAGGLRLLTAAVNCGWGKGRPGQRLQDQNLVDQDSSMLSVRALVWQEQFSSNNNDLNLNTSEAGMYSPVATALTPPSLTPTQEGPFMSDMLAFVAVGILTFETSAVPPLETPV